MEVLEMLEAGGWREMEVLEIILSIGVKARDGVVATRVPTGARRPPSLLRTPPSRAERRVRCSARKVLILRFLPPDLVTFV